MVHKEALDKELGWTEEFDMKNLDECAATHVVAAFDPRIDCMCLGKDISTTRY